MSDQIKVVVRVRPLIQREEAGQSQINWIVENENVIKQCDSSSIKSSVSSAFHFDKIFDLHCSNRHVYTESVQSIVHAAMQGFNGTVFAYGQTASGKTYTIMGCEEQWGIIPYTINEIFETIENSPNREFLLRVSYMELYNEIVTDLLSGQSKLKIKEAQNGEIFVADLKEEIVRSPEMIYQLIETGEGRRHFGETNMNDRSSRSHTIFKIVVESREIKSAESADSSENGVVMVSHLNIVDLAGSERTGQMGATGDRFKEGCAINKSLSTLSQVISKLSESSVAMNSSGSEMSFVNFRDSKLTRILQNSLGGNSKTAIICTVTPASIDETMSTLKFASRAKNIQNKPVKNEVLNDGTMLRRCQKHINELKKQIHDLANATNWQQEKDVLTKQLSEKEERISQLTRLFCISSKIVASPTPEAKIAAKNRRITWCPGARNAPNPLPLFSPIRYKRVDSSLYNVTDQSSSFLHMDKDMLIKELEKEEMEKIDSFCNNNNNATDQSVSVFSLPVPSNVQINRRVNFLTPIRESENMVSLRDVSLQTDLLENCYSVIRCETCSYKGENNAANDLVDGEMQTTSSHIQMVGDTLIDSGLNEDGDKSNFAQESINRKCSNTECQTENFNIVSSISSNVTDVQEVSNLCETLMAEKQLLESHLAACRKELSAAKNDFDFVSNMYMEVQTQYEQLNNSLGRQSNIHSDSIVEYSQHELATLQSTLDEYNEKLEKLSATVASLTSKNEILLKERDEANKQCETSFLDVWQANRKTLTAEREVMKCEAAIHNLNVEIEELKEQLKTSTTTAAICVEEKSSETIETQTDFVDVKEKVSVNQIVNSEELQVLTSQLNGLKSEILKLAAERDEANTQSEFLYNEVVKANAKTSSVEKESKANETTIENLLSEIEQLKGQLTVSDKTGCELFDTCCQTDSLVENPIVQQQHQSVRNVEMAFAEVQTDFIIPDNSAVIKIVLNCVDQDIQTDSISSDVVESFKISSEIQTDLLGEQLQSETDRYKQHCTKLESILNQMEVENRRMSSELEHVRMGMSDLNQVSREQLAQSEAAIAESNEKIDALKKQISELENRLKSLNEVLQDVEIKRVEILKRNNELEEEKVDLLDRVTDAEHNLKSSQLDIDQLESYKTTLLTKESEIERLKRVCENLRKRRDELADQGDEEERIYKQTLDEKQAEIDTLKAEINSLKIAVEKQKSFANNGSENEAFVKENEKLRGGLERMYQEQHLLKMENAQLHSDMALIEEPWRRNETKLKIDLQYKDKRVQELKDQLRRLEERLQGSEPTIQIPAASQNQLSLKRTNSHSLVATTATGSGIMDDHKVFVLQAQNHQQTKTIDKLQKELAEARSDLEEARAKVLEIEKEKKDASANYNLLTVSGSTNRDRSQSRARTPSVPPSPSTSKKLNRVVSESPASRSRKNDKENDKPSNKENHMPSDCKPQ